MQRSIALAHAFADETRWRIATLVAGEALCVCELADILGLPQSTLSSHLQVMRKGGLVTAERCDKWAYYRMAAEVVLVWKAMRALDDATPGSDRKLASDGKKAAARLALRGQSDCKGPRRSIPPARPSRRTAASARQ
jgi:ArsR family transcriptional regulator